MLDPFKKSSSKSAEERVAELQALVAAAREERAALSAMLGQVQVQTSRLIKAGQTIGDLDAGVTKLDGRADEVQARLDRLQHATSALADDLRNMHDVSRLIRDETAAVAAVARDVEGRLGSLHQFQQLSRAADDRLAALLTVASQAAEKMQTLAEQAEVLERAVAQSAQLDALMRRMDAHVSRLQEAEQRVEATRALAEQVKGQSEPVVPPPARPDPRERRATAGSRAIVDMLADLRARVDTIATERKLGPFATASCTRLGDMAHEAQSAIAALQHGA